MLPAKTSVTIKLIIDKNGITQIWSDCAVLVVPVAGLLQNPKDLFLAAMCEIALYGRGAQRAAEG
jgi:hypothetical protein